MATVDNEMHCAVLFTDLLKAFATVDHFALLNKSDIGTNLKTDSNVIGGSKM